MAVKLYKDGVFNFPDKKKGDTFTFAGKEFQFKVRKPTVSNPDNTLVSVRMMFRSGSTTGTLTKSISNGSGITINDTTTWLMTIDSFTIDWDVGVYYYDIETTDSEGYIDTFAGGRTEIKQDVTYT